MIAAGEKAPLFVATAVASNRRIDLEDWLGTPILLAFVDYRTASRMRDITATLRAVYPLHTDVLLVTVADMQVVPGLMRGVARGMMAGAYRTAAAEIPTGYDPADQLIILPDWEAKICRAYGVADVGREPALALVDKNGRVHATYQGAEPAAGALELVRNLLGTYP